MHAIRKIAILSDKHSFTLHPSLSPYSQTELLTEEGIHSLHVGWRNFFSSCAVVSVFGSGGELVLVLHTYVLRVQNQLWCCVSFLVLAGNSFLCYVST